MPTSALQVLRPRLVEIEGYGLLEPYQELRLATALDSFMVEIDIPSDQVTRVADTLRTVDVAVRRATAILNDYPLDRRGGLPTTSATIGGLVFQSADVGSFHVRAFLHGMSRQTVLGGRAALMALLIGLGGVSGNVVNDYLEPHLPGLPPGPAVQVHQPNGPGTPIHIDPHRRPGGRSNWQPPVAGSMVTCTLTFVDGQVLTLVCPVGSNLP